MRILISTNLREGKGLARDYEVLRERLVAWGHTVFGWQFDSSKLPPKADLVMCLEVVPQKALEAAPRRWLIPNPEWWDPERDSLLSEFELVACKTRDALRLFSSRTRRAVYLGFTTSDRYDASVPREWRVLHNPGGSIMRGTEAVLEAWRSDDLDIPLTVVASIPIRNCPKGVQVLGRLEDSDHRRLQNACPIHLCPSAYEGFGHALHEAASVGAIIVTTDAPPMNEVPGHAVRVPAVSFDSRCIARTAAVSSGGVRAAVLTATADARSLSSPMRKANREQWEVSREQFGHRLRTFLS